MLEALEEEREERIMRARRVRGLRGLRKRWASGIWNSLDVVKIGTRYWK